MTHQDRYALAGALVAFMGAALAMVGTVLQMNGYYAFETRDMFVHLWRMISELVLHGPTAAKARLDYTVGLAARRGENRAKTMIGLYLIMLGFSLQTIGSALMIWGLL